MVYLLCMVLKIGVKDGNIYVEVKDYEKDFDIALRKYITRVSRDGNFENANSTKLELFYC